MQITTKEVLAELRREQGMRERVYPAWVKSGRIARAEADKRLAAITKAIDDLEILYGAGSQGDLL